LPAPNGIRRGELVEKDGENVSEIDKWYGKAPGVRALIDSILITVRCTRGAVHFAGLQLCSSIFYKPDPPHPPDPPDPPAPPRDPAAATTCYYLNMPIKAW